MKVYYPEVRVKISGRRGRPPPIIFAPIVRPMNALQLCPRQFSRSCYGWGATSENRSKIGHFAPTRSLVLTWKRVSPGDTGAGGKRRREETGKQPAPTTTVARHPSHSTCSTSSSQPAPTMWSTAHRQSLQFLFPAAHLYLNYVLNCYLLSLTGVIVCVCWEQTRNGQKRRCIRSQNIQRSVLTALHLMLCQHFCQHHLLSSQSWHRVQYQLGLYIGRQMVGMGWDGNKLMGMEWGRG